MKPYGLRRDHHRYVLSDNGRRDADMTRHARKRARAEEVSAVEESVEGDRCPDCDRSDRVCRCCYGCGAPDVYCYCYEDDDSWLWDHYPPEPLAVPLIGIAIRAA